MNDTTKETTALMMIRAVEKYSHNTLRTTAQLETVGTVESAPNAVDP